MRFKSAAAIVIGLGAGVWFGAKVVRKTMLVRRAARWPAVLGCVMDSCTFKDPSNQGKTHFRVLYEYEVMGQRLEGSTPRAAGDWFYNKRQQQAFVDRFVPGAAVPVFYDPLRPHLSCLDRTDLSGIYAMCMIVVGAVSLTGLMIWLNAQELALLLSGAF